MVHKQLVLGGGCRGRGGDLRGVIGRRRGFCQEEVQDRRQQVRAGAGGGAVNQPGQGVGEDEGPLAVGSGVLNSYRIRVTFHEGRYPHTRMIEVDILHIVLVRVGEDHAISESMGLAFQPIKEVVPSIVSARKS